MSKLKILICLIILLYINQASATSEYEYKYYCGSDYTCESTKEVRIDSKSTSYYMYNVNINKITNIKKFINYNSSNNSFDSHNWLIIKVDNKYYLKNWCSDNSCTFTSKKEIKSPNSTNIDYYYIEWQITNNRLEDTLFTFGNASFDKIDLSAWEITNLSFNFNDYIDNNKFTNYTYTVKQSLNWWQEEELFTNHIKLNNSTLKDTWENAKRVTPTRYKNPKEININVIEDIALTKAWNYTFSIYITNENTWKTISKQVNTSINVISSDKIWSWSTIEIYSQDWIEASSNKKYSSNEIFKVVINLEDIYWNPYIDPNNSFKTKVSFDLIWSNNSISLSNTLLWDYRKWVNINWINNEIVFYLKPTNLKNNKITWFKVIWNWVNSNLYLIPKVSNLYISDNVKSDFIFNKYINKSITIQAKCIDDNFSWCENWNIISKTFTEEGLYEWYLTWIYDKAWNEEKYFYSIKSIDKTKPVIKLDCPWLSVWSDWKNYFSEKKLVCNFNFKEETKQYFSPKSLKVVYNNPEFLKSWSVEIQDQTDPNYIEPLLAKQLDYSDKESIKSPLFLEFTDFWTYKFKVTWSDLAWNIADEKVIEVIFTKSKVKELCEKWNIIVPLISKISENTLWLCKSWNVWDFKETQSWTIINYRWSCNWKTWWNCNANYENKIVKTYCWDWIIQRPNNDFINESCDWGFYCDSNCNIININTPSIQENTVRSRIWDYSSYIENWVDNWSDCSIDSNWTNQWTITCKQKRTWNPIRRSCWNQYQDIKTIITPIYTSYIPWYKTWTWCLDNPIAETCKTIPEKLPVFIKNDITYEYTYPFDYIGCKFDLPKPEDEIDIKTFKIDNLNNPIVINNNVFANNEEEISIKINISWTTNWNKSVTWLNWNHSNITNITDTSWLKANRLDWGWDNALNFTNTSSTIIWNWSNFYFNITWITSVSPLESIWTLSFNLDGSTINIWNIPYKFKKPFTWKLEVSDDGYNWNAKPKVWPIMKYKLTLNKLVNLYNLNNLHLDDLLNKLSLSTNSLLLQSKNLLISSLLSDPYFTIFEARINNLNNLKLESNYLIWFNSDNLPIISYNLNWKLVKYYLSKNESWNNNTEIKIDNGNFIWVNIFWVKQINSDSRTNITSQWNNFSNLSESKMRSEIKKSAYNYIKPMTNNQVVNKVKYINWEDITISWNITDYETLVVENWNIIINWDLWWNSKPLWIIVLKDNYKVQNGYSDKWNIYIKPNVRNVNAVIYADWWLISVDTSWNLYTSDSTTRTNELNNSLTIKWSMFTRNTVWWAILFNWSYLLPWWIETTDFDKAMIYDLNYLRTWKVCTTNDLVCPKYTSTFNIYYDPKIQTNPPKLFYK